MELDFSKYPTPGIYQEETNGTALVQSDATESIINFVPGFSRKGVFNRPVLVSTDEDALRYFGPVDRTLESKGSFFHRTIKTMLQQGPVWALNLLSTTAVDTLAFRSVSLSPQFDNSAELSIPYASVFRRDGFWSRDTDLFTFAANGSNLSTNNADKVLHMTNISDKKVSVFMLKSKALGFDVTAEAWYGGRDLVPAYIHPLARIADYMVRVLVLAGDWSDYRTLANDSHWSRYFNASGLRQNTIDAFAADRQVTRLLDREVSLIPYFRDRNNNNLFIESVLNSQTDRTGLFVAFDTDKFETDMPNGFIDLIGNSLAGSDREAINFMSYSDTIIETDEFAATPLDRTGNVAGIGQLGSRTTRFHQGYVEGVAVGAINAGTATFNVTEAAFAVIGGKRVDVANGNFVTELQQYPAPNPGTGRYYVNTFVLNTDGTIAVLQGTPVLAAAGLDETNARNIAASRDEQLYPRGYANSAVVLGYVFSRLDVNGLFQSYQAVAVNSNGYVPLAMGSDIKLEPGSANNLKYSFTGTAAGVGKANYVAWRRKQFFDALVAGKDLQRSAIIAHDGVKYTFNNRATWEDNSQSTSTDDKYFSVTIAGVSLRGGASAGNLALYFKDDEVELGVNGLKTNPTAGFGRIGKYSKFAKSFYDGMIKTGDFFYPTVQKDVAAAFSKDANGNDVITLSNVNGTLDAVLDEGYVLYISGHPVNSGKYTIQSIARSGSSYALVVSEAVTPQPSLPVSVHSFMEKTYLKLYTVNDEITCDFTDKAYASVNPLQDVAANATLQVFSGEEAYAQTVELEFPSGYLMQDTKILVDSARYPEIAVGDYLQAYVDEDSLEIGEAPRRMTRIISKRPWTGNVAGSTKYAEIITDAKIYLDNFGDDYQTTRYTGVDSYVDTFKAVVLSGFQVHTESMPNGTEERQNKVLNVMQKGTAMFEAITNKNRFSFRYLVDSFGKGLTEFSKQQIADICGKRKNCLGFISAPSMKDFRKSTSPSFIDGTGALKVQYISTGGDLESNPAFSFGLAVGQGAACVGYFAPYAITNENGRPLAVPMAPYAACTYMRKQNTSNSGVYPWTIAAGSENGLIKGIANVEYDFTDSDVKWLNQMGINPVMYKLNTGFCIETENTAEQSPKSSLSYLHTREVLIELENELYAMLLPYQWKFNIPAIRAEIKQKADDICDRFVERNALFDYKNVCDTSNNTPIVIDNQFGLLDTYVEVVKGMGVIVNTINVEKTGSINASTGSETILSSGFGG